MQVSWQRTLDTLRPAADSAETVEEKIYDLALSRNGGICCYSTQCGSAHIPLSPVAEGQPAICPLPPSDPGTLFARLSRRLSFEFFWLWPPRGKACYYFIYLEQTSVPFFDLGLATIRIWPGIAGHDVE